MSARACTIDSCAKPARKRGHLCSMHNSRKMRHGDPLAVKPGTRRNPKPVPESYPGAHRHVERARGRAADHCCVAGCGRPARAWAYDHSDTQGEIVTERGPYSPDVDRYFPLCVSDHIRFDRRHAAWRREAVRS